MLVGMAIAGIVITAAYRHFTNVSRILRVDQANVTQERILDRFQALLTSDKALRHTIRLDRNADLFNHATGVAFLPSGTVLDIALYNNKGELVAPAGGRLYDRDGKPTTNVSEALWKVTVQAHIPADRTYTLRTDLQALQTIVGDLALNGRNFTLQQKQQPLTCFELTTENPTTGGNCVSTGCAGGQAWWAWAGFNWTYGATLVSRPAETLRTLSEELTCPADTYLTRVGVTAGCNSSGGSAMQTGVRSGQCSHFQGKEDGTAPCPNANAASLRCSVTCCRFP